MESDQLLVINLQLLELQQFNLPIKGSDRLCMVVELSRDCSQSRPSQSSI